MCISSSFKGKNLLKEASKEVSKTGRVVIIISQNPTPQNDPDPATGCPKLHFWYSSFENKDEQQREGES